MKLKTLTMGLKRDIRLAKYNVPGCSVQLSVELEEADDLEECKVEVHDALISIVEDMIEEEKKNYREILKSGIENKLGK